MKAVRCVGVALIVLSGLGFLTVADDLRHTGELLGVSALGVAGVALAASAHAHLKRRR